VVGNSALWWRPESAGYTINISDAGKYDEDFVARHNRPTDVCIPCEAVDELIESHVRADLEKFVALRNRFRKFKSCPKCGGDGYLDRDFCSDQQPWKCHECKGKGFIPAEKIIGCADCNYTGFRAASSPQESFDRMPCGFCTPATQSV
jgi:DnaJ-class molecular chaperone